MILVGRDLHDGGRGTQKGGEVVVLEAGDDTEDDNDEDSVDGRGDVVDDCEDNGEVLVPVDSVALGDALKTEVSELAEELPVLEGAEVKELVNGLVLGVVINISEVLEMVDITVPVVIDRLLVLDSNAESELTVQE